MPKSQIRPPRTPIGESMKVTIANQKREIDNLILRIGELSDMRDALQKDLWNAMHKAEHYFSILGERQDEIASHKSAGEALCSIIEEMKKAHTRLQGWQDCAREVFSEMLSKS